LLLFVVTPPNIPGHEPLALRLESWIVGTGVLGALATVVWLLVKGVDEQEWKEQANAAAASIWR